MSIPNQPSPPSLQLLDSAGIRNDLLPLAQRAGLLLTEAAEDGTVQTAATGDAPAAASITTIPTSAAATPAGTVATSTSSFRVKLQSVPATADAHWFEHVAPDHVPVRFHLPRAAELVVLPSRSETQVSHAADLLVQLGLSITLAPARPGLVIDRVRHAYFNEGLALLGEGVPAERIEQAALDAGYRAGPLALLDEQGLATTDALYHQSLGGNGCGCGCGHDHDHSHEHEHGHDHGHGHGHGHNHDHGHGHDHAHHDEAHSHAHDHAHHHDEAHGHANHHEHAHDHGHAGDDHSHGAHGHEAHGHTHTEGCGCASHAHTHADGHGHDDHEHGHSHAHDHGREHAHGHGHEHHGHGQGHEHHEHAEDHPHDHGHAHTHEHTHDHDAHGHGAAEPAWPALTEEAAYAMEKMAHGFQRKGRAQGAGFYDYDDDEEEEPDLWSGLSAFVRKSLKMPADDVRDRLQYITWAELLNSLQARALGNAAAAAVSARSSGLWADDQPDPLATLRAQDAAVVGKRATELAERYGQRFVLPAGWQALIQ
jgi:hypothetical protein